MNKGEEIAIVNLDADLIGNNVLLTHNREYWNVSLAVVVKNFYQFGLWTLIIYKFLKLKTSVRVKILLNL